MDLDRLGSLLIAQPLIRSGLLPGASGIPILMYHSVSDDPEVGVPGYYRLATSPARFREQMKWLRDHGYRTISIPELGRQLTKGELAADREVVLTFDDGFADFYTHAWPTMQEFGFSATVFLATGFIGSPRRRFKDRECLTWSEVHDLYKAGVAFGAHTVTHPTLYRLSWDEIGCQLRDSRQSLEDALGTQIDAFAYPYAFPQEDHEFVSRFRDELRQAGYTISVTTVVGTARPSADPLALKRLPVNEADDVRLFATKMSGGYDWVGGAQSISRRLKRRIRTDRA